MAFGDDQGKTEKPTPGRLSEVRDRGDSSLSRELVSAGTLLGAAVALRFLGGWLVEGLAAAMQFGLVADLSVHPIASADVPGACRELLAYLLLVAAPFATLVLLLVLAAIAFGYGQIGFQWSRQALGFRLDRANPVNNWKRVFHPSSIVRTAIAGVKLLALVGVAWLAIGGRIGAIASLHELPLPSAMAFVADLALSLLLWVAVVTVAISFADVLWQRFSFEKRNMMTRQEVEDERRRSEGDPMVKSRQRQARMELLRHRMMEAVPKADVVITNPTHFSVALSYDRGKHRAPQVVAKGVDELALRIREVAKTNGVALLEDPPLARALYRGVKVGQEVPEKFYQAIATVLSHVYRLKGRVA